MLWSTSGEGGSQGSGRAVRPAPPVPGAVGLELLVCMVSFVVADCGFFLLTELYVNPSKYSRPH